MLRAFQTSNTKVVSLSEVGGLWGIGRRVSGPFFMGEMVLIQSGPRMMMFNFKGLTSVRDSVGLGDKLVWRYDYDLQLSLKMTEKTTCE
jgi:hypothetical protein